MSFMRGGTTLAAVALTLTVSACSTGRAAEDPDPFRAPASVGDDVLLTVENNDFRDANIFAYWDGVRDRVGFVTGKTSKTFRMRWRAERMQIGVDFVGRGSYRTENVDVWGGDHINFVIPIR